MSPAPVVPAKNTSSATAGFNMATGAAFLPKLYPINGIRLGSVRAGIKPQANCDDVVVIALGTACTVATVFTQNSFCAAPVQVAKAHLATGSPHYLLINTGNANAGTGERGLADAKRCCEAVANLTDVHAEAVLPFSTGVIGEYLPVDVIIDALPEALEDCHAEGWERAASAILTTDTRPKGSSQKLQVDGQTVTVTGIAKGSGMIRPDMATMLAYLATDAAVAPEVLQGILNRVVAKSFNRITVDGDTSTNDACVLISSAAAGNTVIADAASEHAQQLEAAITDLAIDLAQAIVRDGEGASKFVTVRVEQGDSVHQCEQVAFTVAHSPLVKTALFASDANWGRILAAVGRAGVPDLDVNAVELLINGVLIAQQGARAAEYKEEDGTAAMAGQDIEITVRLGRGDAEAEVWTSDLSHDYVSINADYRS